VTGAQSSNGPTLARRAYNDRLQAGHETGIASSRWFGIAFRAIDETGPE